MVQNVVVTGAAGFIGYHVCASLIDKGYHVVGIDNMNDYYDVALKQARLSRLVAHKGRFDFRKADIGDTEAILDLFKEVEPAIVINLAAQAGVRYSLLSPHTYVKSNIAGFLNVLEGCRHHDVRHLIYASSSSVYGANTQMPFSVHHSVDHPLSLYAATKRADELMAHSYSHLYGIPTTGLRLFTVYGPWGRPDMALFIFTKAILGGHPIRVFNRGDMQRDFTYIDDVVEALVNLIPCIPEDNDMWSGAKPDPATSRAPYRLYNVGNNSPTKLMQLIEVLEDYLGKKAVIEFLPMQPGDVPATYADTEDLCQRIGFHPRTPIRTGVGRFVEWYKAYYGVG